MLPKTSERVPRHTPRRYNARIRQEMQESLAWYEDAGPAAIERRIDDLDREWDIERMLEANAATATLFGLALGTFVDKRFFAIPAIVGGFLLQHALQGWCPPMPVFRHMGVRTMREIDEERFALVLMLEQGEGRSVNGGAPRQAAD